MIQQFSSMKLAFFLNFGYTHVQIYNLTTFFFGACLTHYPENWFLKWFDEWYLLVYSHRNQKEAIQFVENWPIWKSILPQTQNRTQWALDLGCGSGRYSQAIAKKGFNVLGLDTSAKLLRIALSENISSSKLNLVRADMRKLPVNTSFMIILSLFTSFGYFETDHEHQEIINSAYSNLKKGGYFVLDIPNRDYVINRVKSNNETSKIIDQIKIVEIREIDSAQKRIIKTIFIDTGKKKLEYVESVRLFSDNQIQSMLNIAGFKLNSDSMEKHKTPWGNYEGDPLDASKPRMIYFGEKDV